VPSLASSIDYFSPFSQNDDSGSLLDSSEDSSANVRLLRGGFLAVFGISFLYLVFLPQSAFSHSKYDSSRSVLQLGHVGTNPFLLSPEWYLDVVNCIFTLESAGKYI
jgi:hypothetical protein